MSKVTENQRLHRRKQPFTRTERVPAPRVEATPDGPIALRVYVYQLTGYTFETRLVDPEAGKWITVEEQHDLGQAATLPGASEVAGKWRADLNGVYGV